MDVSTTQRALPELEFEKLETCDEYSISDRKHVEVTDCNIGTTSDRGVVATNR